MYACPTLGGVGCAQACSLVEEVGGSAGKLLIRLVPVEELLPVFRVGRVRAGRGSSSSTSAITTGHEARGTAVGTAAVRHALTGGRVEALALWAAAFTGRLSILTLPEFSAVGGVAIASAWG